MFRLLVITFAVLAVVSAVVRVEAQGETPQVAMGTPVTWTYNATPATTVMTVAIVDNPSPPPTALFEPETVGIAVGDTVIWTNLDESATGNQHTATSDAADPSGDAVFDSDVLVPGASYAHTFDTAGEFTYFCAIHPNMMGVINVS
jgi:plastocyanin